MLNPHPSNVTNNLVLELHVPSFQLARNFYGIFSFKEHRYDPGSELNNYLGYLVLSRNDAVGETF